MIRTLVPDACDNPEPAADPVKYLLSAVDVAAEVEFIVPSINIYSLELELSGSITK